MKYRVTWDETFSFSAIVEANSMEDAIDALHAGDYDNKECTGSEFDGTTSHAEPIN